MTRISKGWATQFVAPREKLDARAPMELPDMRRRVVYIASLGHSGSTLLDLILGTHSSVVGLGEVGRAVEATATTDAAQSHGTVCSCGYLADDCRFWGKLLPRIEAEPVASYARRYRILLDAFGEAFGPETILVDSSKYLGRLATLKDLDGIDLRVLFLVRDVRSFTTSEIDTMGRRQAVGRDGRRRGPFETFRRWHVENCKTERFLVANRMPFFRLGYEELCLAPERILPRICEFLDIDYEAAMLVPERSTSHVIRGNRMRHDSRRRVVSYDPRWLVRREWVLPALLCRRIMRFNRDQVYSNGLVEDWSR
jgi:hypothetical protein